MNIPSSLRAVHRSPRSRGQAVIELALVAPLVLAFVFAVISFWLYYQKAATYTSASQTLAEWIARDGQYTSSMGSSIQSMLDEAIGVDTANTYLTIVIVDSDGNQVVAGESVPSTTGAAPGDTGWNDDISGIVAGDFIQVDIWSYHTVGAASLNVGLGLVPDGHAVMRSMWIEATP